MADIYRVFADRIEYDEAEVWSDEHEDFVLFGQIEFVPDTERQPKNWLGLSREWVVNGRVERYEGPIVIAVTGAEAEGGIAIAELTRQHLRLEFDADTAAIIEDPHALIEFDLNDAEWAKFRQELTTMLEGVWTLHVRE